MDDARIQSLRQEVLAQLRDGTAREADRSGLEARVAALEAALAQLAARGMPGGPAGAPAPTTAGSGHPSFQLFAVAGPSPERCVMEPDKPCVKSHACRTFGY